MDKKIYTVQSGSIETIIDTIGTIQSTQESHYYISADAQVHYFFIIGEDNLIDAIKICFFLARNAQLTAELLCAHSNMRIDIEVILVEEGAQASIRGAYLLDQTNIIQIQTVQHHQAAHTKSDLVMRSAVRDNGYATYHGMIRIDKNARESVSSQENKNILLSDRARALSVPSLEVLTNDVRCFHGSAIGRFDEEQLIYAASRGIGQKEARKLLLNGFFGGLFTSQIMQQHVGRLLEEISF